MIVKTIESLLSSLDKTLGQDYESQKARREKMQNEVKEKRKEEKEYKFAKQRKESLQRIEELSVNNLNLSSQVIKTNITTDRNPPTDINPFSTC